MPFLSMGAYKFSAANTEKLQHKQKHKFTYSRLQNHVTEKLRTLHDFLYSASYSLSLRVSWLAGGLVPSEPTEPLQ